MIDGVVTHDVLTIGGDVRLGPKAVVRGSVTTIGGVLRADPAAHIAGTVSELSLDKADLRVWWPENGTANSFNIGITPDWSRIARVAFYGGLLMSAVWIVLCAGVLVIAPGAVTRTREQIARTPIAAFIVGVATEVLFAPIAALLVTVLAISVIGIPLIALVPVAMFALFLATLFGSAAIFQSVGERLVGRALPLLSVLAGAALFVAMTLVGRYVWMRSGGTLGWGLGLSSLGLLVEFVVVTIGLGGAVLSFTRRIAWRRKHAAASSVSTDTPIEPVF
jgi:hypothetical protein